MKNFDELKDKALEYLYKDKLKNCDLIVMIVFYDKKIKFYYVKDDGVCFTVPTNNIVCISTDNEGVANKIVKLFDKCNYCICKNLHDKNVFADKFTFKNIEECYQVVFNSNERNIKNCIGQIKQLENSHIDFMVEHYSGHTSREELETLFKLYKFYGMFVEDKLVGFVGRHQDGEIGYLEVIKEYQRKGIASALLNHIVKKSKEDNLIPYSQIKVDNIKSIELHKKFDCTFCPTTVYWCYN